jgi:6-pyruvoyltetrahydropterin/6-carboxytetrahydropterin synthase
MDKDRQERRKPLLMEDEWPCPDTPAREIGPREDNSLFDGPRVRGLRRAEAVLYGAASWERTLPAVRSIIGETMPGVFEVFFRSGFAAAHRLCDYPGDCARLHGHNWTVEVYVECRELNEIGIGIDFYEIDKALNKIMVEMDHSNLNDLPAFKDQNPTSENVARYVYRELARELNAPAIKVVRVKVCETPDAGVVYREE